MWNVTLRISPFFHNALACYNDCSFNIWVCIGCWSDSTPPDEPITNPKLAPSLGICRIHTRPVLGRSMTRCHNECHWHGVISPKRLWHRVIDTGHKVIDLWRANCGNNFGLACGNHAMRQGAACFVAITAGELAFSYHVRENVNDLESKGQWHAS